MNKFITIYILNRKQDTAVWLVSLVAITLLLLRVKITHSMYLLFLIWNLFLAFIPYFLSSNIYNNFFDRSKKTQNNIMIKFENDKIVDLWFDHYYSQFGYSLGGNTNYVTTKSDIIKYIKKTNSGGC